MKRPSFQWYPGDFRRDTGVQACCFEARALWREMMDLMHDGEPYGHLTAGGVAIAVENLSRLVGVPAIKVKRWLKELEDHKVFSRTDTGVIYSRRMLRDEHIRNVRADAGKLGGSKRFANDLLKQNSSNGAANENLGGKQKAPPAVAVASARTTNSMAGVLKLPKAYSAEFLQLWADYPARSGSAAKEKASIQVAARLREGVALELLLEKTQAYRTWAEATGKVGTEKVMQAARFYGASREYESGNWSIPAVVTRADEARKRGYV